MKRIFIYALIITAALFLLTSAALAMSSTNYSLDWFIPLTGGGDVASSTGYTIHLSAGQAVYGTTGGVHHTNALLGYWPGAITDMRIFMPLMQR